MSGVLRTLISRTAPVVQSQAVQKATIMSGPPRVAISMTEKSVVGAVLSFGICAGPGYIMMNLLGYRERA